MDRMTACSVRSYKKIYTRTGDKGTSATFTGVRMPKDDPIFNALGATDELSSAIGMAAEHCHDAGHPMEDKLRLVQCALQEVGSNIATPISSARAAHLKQVQFNTKFTTDLEIWIDEMTETLPPLKNFILPSGGKSSCSLHFARSVCRRAERSMSPLIRDKEISEGAFIFMNSTSNSDKRQPTIKDPLSHGLREGVNHTIERLSDFLFTAARFCAMLEGKEEKVYIKKLS